MRRSLKVRHALAAGFAIVGLSCAQRVRQAPVQSSSQSPCLVASEYGDWGLADLKWLDTASDTASVSRRQRWNLPDAPVAQIRLVTDTTKCRRAVNAYNAALLPDTAVSVSVYLYSFGAARYVAVDTTRHAGEWDLHVVFDTSFSAPLRIFRE